MKLTPITRKQAAALAGATLPYGLRWYQVDGLEWFPMYGAWRYVFATANGLRAVIGKRKAKSEARAAA